MNIIKTLVKLAVVTALSTSLAPITHAGAFGDRPDVLVCSVQTAGGGQPWDRLVFYVSARLENGGVLYKSLTSNPVLVTITSAGVVDASNLKDCDGKTIAELRQEGRAFDF